LFVVWTPRWGCLMSTANLTAADLAELETRMAALERSILDAPGAAETPTVDAWQAVATTTALLTALREARAERDEARALVEALVEYEPATWGGVDGDNCYWCDRLIRQHAPDCAWDAARKARDAWKGNE
jgi:hypothetical protein